jgi:hypothetical protein
LLYRVRPSLAGIKRYAAALGVWIAITGATYEINDKLATAHEYIWYWSQAYEDIAGTLEYMPDVDDATLSRELAGVPLLVHDHIQAAFRSVYTASNFYHLMRGDQRLLDPPSDEAERAAVGAAWHRLVAEYPSAYLRYRWDSFSLLVKLDRPPTNTNIYTWLTVINAPDTIGELGHDATSSRLQSHILAAATFVSLSPVYFIFIYFALAFALLPIARRHAEELALLLSAIGYELAWFFLAVTTDVRYSQWMELATLTAAVLVGIRFARRPKGVLPEPT